MTSEHGSNILINNKYENLGQINPLNIKTKISLLNIDSRFRNNYFGTNASNYSFELPVIQNKVISLKVLSVNIPLTYYSISQNLNNNTFLIYSNNGTYQSWLVTLPDGNYDLSWFNQHVGDNLELRMNEAIINSQPGLFDISTGVFTPKTDGTIKNLTNENIYFASDKVNGRGMFTMLSAVFCLHQQLQVLQHCIIFTLI